MHKPLSRKVGYDQAYKVVDMDVANLLTEAETALRKADPLCTSGETYYAEIKMLIEQATVLWARILFLNTAQQDQLQIIGSISVVVHSSFEKMHTQCESKIKTLIKVQKELQSLISTLKETGVDSAFGGHKNLFEYIDEESAFVLEKKANELIDSLKLRLNMLKTVPSQIQKQLALIRSESPTVPAALNSETLRTLNKISRKCGTLINEMAIILTSLTNNYDLCSQIPTLNEQDAEEATNVVINDRDQVFRALDQLNKFSSRLKSKYAECQQMQHSLAMTLEKFISFDDEMSDFIEKKLKASLIKMNDTSNECSSIFTQIDEVANETSSLTEYYRLFIKSYNALVLEVLRRKKSHSQFEKLVENINHALDGFRQREIDAREGFFNTYNEYIPIDLWRDMLSMPREYKVEINPENLPDLSKDTIERTRKT